MSTKKKFIIAICAVGVVAISAIATLIAVLAAFNAKTTGGGFVISYSAKNVHATIAAEYKIDDNNDETTENYTTIKTTDSEDLITFTGTEEDEEVTKSFNKIDDIKLGKNDTMYIHYTITNTDDSALATTFSVTSAAAVTSDNLTIEYSTSLEEGAEWKATLAEVADVASVENGTPLNLYVRIYVTTKTKSATFDGSFNFTLTVNE